MSLIVVLTNDGTGSNESANYVYTVRVNERILDSGRLHGHNRAHGWPKLLRELATLAAAKAHNAACEAMTGVKTKAAKRGRGKVKP